MSYREKAQDIYAQVGQGKAIEAFNQYYADNVVMVMEDGTEVAGKDTNLQREIDFFSSVEEFRGLTVISITSDEDAGVSTVQCEMVAKFKGMDDAITINQVAVQNWEGDHIVRERFYGTK